MKKQIDPKIARAKKRERDLRFKRRKTHARPVQGRW